MRGFSVRGIGLLLMPLLICLPRVSHSAEGASSRYLPGVAPSTFSCGARGCYYDQISGGSGDGALLVDFESFSWGLGAGFVRLSEIVDGQLSLAGRFMRHIEAENRFDSDQAQFLVGWRF